MGPSRLACRLLPVGLVLAGAVTFGACGGGSHGNGEAIKPASQVLSDTEQASAAASSARISGNITSNGTQIQLQVVDGHNRGGGTVGVNGATFQTVLDGQEVYLKADAATWTKSANPAVAQLLANRWLKTTTSDQNFSSFAKLLDISQLVTNLKASGTVTKEATTKVDGISVIPLKDNGPQWGHPRCGHHRRALHHCRERRRPRPGHSPIRRIRLGSSTRRPNRGDKPELARTRHLDGRSPKPARTRRWPWRAHNLLPPAPTWMGIGVSTKPVDARFWVVTRCALAGLLLVFGAIVITTGSDPLAVAALAALSLTVFVAWASLNRMPRPAPSLRAGFPGPTPRLCAEGPRPVDHDCPVTLSVIRR